MLSNKVMLRPSLGLVAGRGNIKAARLAESPKAHCVPLTV